GLVFKVYPERQHQLVALCREGRQELYAVQAARVGKAHEQRRGHRAAHRLRGARAALRGRAPGYAVASAADQV
ncbi:hypothetical protein GGF38_004746, partial [Coemansia sp. RSA 25]